MANYKRLSEYDVDQSPSDGDLIPSIIDNGNGTYTNVLIPYALLKGTPGEDGVGVPAGGTTAQVLRKASGSDYDAEWATMTLDKTAVGLPNVDNTADLNKPVSTATQTAIDTAVALAVAQAKQESYPVGSMYFNADVATNPATLLGFGTWVAHAEGRVPVGKAASGTFGTAGATVGTETHLHGLAAGAAQIGSPQSDASRLGFRSSQNGDLSGTTYNVGGGTPNTPNTRSHNTALTGTTDSSSSIQPSIVVYIWKRTA